MAVLQMRKINICAMKKNRKKILELLQRRGCIEIHESMETDEVFEKLIRQPRFPYLKETRHWAKMH